jgi:acyl-coenzyme A thioesterase PaaI-like protein
VRAAEPEPGKPFGEKVTHAQAAELTAAQVEMRRAGEAVRRIIHKLVATKAPAGELADLATRLERVAEELSPYPQGRAYEGFAESANAGNPHAFFDNSPIMGAANPLAPPMRVEVSDKTVVGRVCFGAAYEGPPGCVHGGYVAATFDEILGMAQALTGLRGMTGTLTVRYRAPTPLHRELQFEAEFVRQERRKIFTVGRCLDGDTVTAEAEAIFVTVDFARIAELYDKRPLAP